MKNELKKEYFGGKKFNFLIVDDDAGIREVISIILEREGHKVKKAVDGTDCINKLTPDIDIIILDIKMPGAKSRDIIEEVRVKSPNAVIIYLTSIKAFDQTLEEIRMDWRPRLESPVIGYINKPVKKKELFEKIEEALKKYGRVLEFRKELPKK